MLYLAVLISETGAGGLRFILYDLDLSFLFLCSSRRREPEMMAGGRMTLIIALFGTTTDTSQCTPVLLKKGKTVVRSGREIR